MSPHPLPPGHPRCPPLTRNGLGGALVLAGLVSLCAGCAAAPPVAAEEPLSDSSEELVFRNGMTPNGLATNGLATNGLATNGLATNGLATNGLLTADFRNWFDSNPPAFSDMVMRYVVACAYASGTRLTYIAETRTYTWNGHLGLAPGWASGLPATVTEQQLISACLGALTNKFGANIEISIRGRDALGSLIPVNSAETSTYSVVEGAFFGNLFAGEGVFVCSSSTTLNASESTARACGLSSQSSGESKECPPLFHKGTCNQYCESYDRRTGTYSRCGHHGVVYTPLTTHLKPSDIYTCGDGVCQVSESCDKSTNGTGSTYDSCSDCGPCGADGGTSGTTDGGTSGTTDGGTSGGTDGGRTGRGGRK